MPEIQSVTDIRRTQAERTAQSDERMLEAAIALIVERGTVNTTLKDVGERAGYSRGLAGYRFGHKAGLLSFVVRSIGEEWLRELTRVTNNRLGLDAINEAIDAHFRFVSDAPAHVRAFYILWFEAIGPQSDVRDVIVRIHDRRRRDVGQWITKAIEIGTIAPAVDAAGIADQFSASIIGIVYQWLVKPEPGAQIKAMHDDLKASMQLLLGSSLGSAN